jgi:hypothetical protein
MVVPMSGCTFGVDPRAAAGAKIAARHGLISLSEDARVKPAALPKSSQSRGRGDLTEKTKVAPAPTPNAGWRARPVHLRHLGAGWKQPTRHAGHGHDPPMIGMW